MQAVQGDHDQHTSSHPLPGHVLLVPHLVPRQDPFLREAGRARQFEHVAPVLRRQRLVRVERIYLVRIGFTHP